MPYTQNTQVNALWLVLKPTPVSELEDLIAGGNIRDLRLQFLGGLTDGEVLAMYTDLDEARARARATLSMPASIATVAIATSISTNVKPRPWSGHACRIACRAEKYVIWSAS